MRPSRRHEQHVARLLDRGERLPLRRQLRQLLACAYPRPSLSECWQVMTSTTMQCWHGMATRLHVEQSWQVWQRRCSAAAPRKGMAAVIALLTQELEDRPPAVERQRRRPEQPELPAVGQAVPRVVVVVRRRSRPRRPGKELNVQRIVPASWPRRPFRRLQIHKARDQRDVLQQGVAAAALPLRLPWSVARVRGEHVLPVHSRSTNKSTARQPRRPCFRKPSSAWSHSVSQDVSVNSAMLSK